MTTANDEPILDAWRANNEAMTFLVRNLPKELWNAGLPESPRKTIRSIAAHVHNSRCSWLRSLAKYPGFRMPARVDARRVTQAALVRALEESNREMLWLFAAGIDNGGDFPGVPSRFVWGAMPRNAILFLAYAVAHEGHHRGQIVMIPRAIGERLPSQLIAGLWQWSSRLRDCRSRGSA